jgi:hypothetical protein
MAKNDIISRGYQGLKNWWGTTRVVPSGNVLQNQITVNAEGLPIPQIINQDIVDQVEPSGTKVPQMVKGRASGWSQIQNLSTNIDIAKVQAAFRAAERGDTTLLFGYYRDLILGTGMVATELSKRKLAILAHPYNIIPSDTTNPDDIIAAKVITDMIDNCDNWNDYLIHLMNSVIFPVAVAEKIFEPWDTDKDGINKLNIRYKLKKLNPLDYMLISYRLPYLPSGPINPTNQPILPSPPSLQTIDGMAQDTIYDPDSWEPDLRFWSVFNNGLINYSWSQLYAPDPNRHFVFRTNLLQGIARENFGGLGRSLLFWAIMAQMGREFWLRFQDQFGSPFIIAKVDTSQTDTVDFLKQSFQESQKLHALMVNKDADIQLAEAASSAASDGHEKFCQFCHDQISLLICGQTLSSNAKATGMGSGVADLQSDVRDDIVSFDRITLGHALRTQLFRQYLRINGFTGCPPKITWGGTSSPTTGKILADTLLSLKNAGIEPTDDAYKNLGDRLGISIKKISVVEKQPFVDKQPFVENEKEKGDNDNEKYNETDEPKTIDEQ